MFSGHFNPAFYGQTCPALTPWRGKNPIGIESRLEFNPVRAKAPGMSKEGFIKSFKIACDARGVNSQ